MVQGQLVTVRDVKDLLTSTMDSLDQLTTANNATRYQLQIGFAVPGLISGLNAEQTKTILRKFQHAIANFHDDLSLSISLNLLEDSPITRELLEKTRGSYEEKQSKKSPAEEQTPEIQAIPEVSEDPGQQV